MTQFLIRYELAPLIVQFDQMSSAGEDQLSVCRPEMKAITDIQEGAELIQSEACFLVESEFLVTIDHDLFLNSAARHWPVSNQNCNE